MERSREDNKRYKQMVMESNKSHVLAKIPLSWTIEKTHNDKYMQETYLII